MSTEAFRNFVKLFTELYLSKDLLITWGQQAGLKLRSDVEPKLEELNIPKEKFIDECFTIISMATHIAAGAVNNDESSEKFQIVRDIFLNDEELFQHINVQTTSQHQILDSVEYEILTKRSPQNVRNILTHSISFTMNTDDRDRENKDTINIELSKKDATELIETLNKALVDLEKLEHID